jgi:DNA-binding response OmpR family regulator
MAGELSGKRVLVVDDDADILTAIRTAMEDAGAEVDTAADGNQAVAKATEIDPDLIILDLMLPKRSGFLVAEKLKSGKDKGEKPRVIMITGNPGQRHRTYADRIGVEAYFTKPFRMDRLVESAEKLFA